jgi:hypothetical protein
MGQSPFALARGQTFEKGLFRNVAQKLREGLIKARVLPDGARGFADFRLRANGGRVRSLDEALQGTGEIFKAIANDDAGDRRRPAIIAAATARLPKQVMLPEAILVADIVAVRYDTTPITITVGEIKTYPDRAGYTEPRELAVARAQLGVYVHGLRTAIAEWGIGHKLAVADRGFLVLTRPGSNQPSIRAGEDLRFQAWRAERGFAQLEAAARSLPPPGDEDPLKAVLNAETAYCEECVSFCDLANFCFGRAMENGDPSFLGEDVGRFLGEFPLDRALALLSEAKPSTPAEEDLLRRMGVRS